MREILFRGKHIHALPQNRHLDGTWVFGYLCDENYINSPELEGEYLVDPETICQYTGLTDKNGRKIFERDIVRYQFDNDDCPFPNKHTEKIIGKVFFSDFRASFSVTAGRNLSASLNNDLFKYVQNGNRVEVIGNIFDNQELIRYKKD